MAKHSGNVTLRLIAEQAGVHPSTASRALNPLKPGRVGKDTVERVRAIATEFGYEPHHWARSLRTNQTMLLGLVIPRLSDNVLTVVFEAAEDQARRHGYHAITMSTGDIPEEQERAVRMLLERRVDGLLLATCGWHDPLPDRLSRDNVPFVLLNRASGAHPCIRGDDEQGGLTATRHLLEQGHRRIGLISGPPTVSTAMYRQSGYRRALEEAGVDVDERLVLSSEFTAESGYEKCRFLLQVDPPPTAIFAVNDATALGAMAAARDSEVPIPQGLAVIGYNDAPISRLLPIPLSTVALPLEEMGRAAVDEVCSVIGGGDEKDVVFPVELRARDSTMGRGEIAGVDQPAPPISHGQW